ncbi:MAG: hypothetical protein ACE5JJ_09085, partial [Nitrospinota bacterium]
MRKIRERAFLWSVLLLFSLITGCATLADPTGPNSSLVIGRVVINNKYPGDPRPSGLGTLPLGTIKWGIGVEIESTDGSQFFEATTGKEGYFMIANIPPDTYYLRRVILKAETGFRRDMATLQLGKLPSFTFVPGKII